MKKVKITVMRQVHHSDLSELYENPLDNACDMEVGMTFVSVGGAKPEGLCASAWESMEKFVLTLAQGGGFFFEDWMKNPYSAMISCNDGFRPVSFYLEALDDNL